MTLIRIEPVEMETASREIRAQAQAAGQTTTGLRGQCTAACLPPPVAAQVDAGLAAIEATLAQLRNELELEASFLTLRGLVASTDLDAAASIAGPAVTTGATVTTGAPTATVTTAGANVLGGGGVVDAATAAANRADANVIGGGSWTDSLPRSEPLFTGVVVVGGENDMSRMLKRMENVPGGVQAIGMLEGFNNRGVEIWLDPSRSSLMAQEGRFISEAEYLRRGYRGLS